MGNLSLKTYADALKGGKDGPAIVPNDPDKSLLVQIQQKGGHAGQFTPEETRSRDRVDQSGRTRNSGSSVDSGSGFNASAGCGSRAMERCRENTYGEMRGLSHQHDDRRCLFQVICRMP